MKMSARDRLPPGLGLDEKRVDARLVMHHDAGAERVEQDIDLVRGQQIVGRDLVGRGVVGLRQDLAEDQMRRVQPAEPRRCAPAARDAMPCTTRCISPWTLACSPQKFVTPAAVPMPPRKP